MPSFIIVRPLRLGDWNPRNVDAGRGTRQRDLRPVAPPLVGRPWRGKWAGFVQSNDYWSGTEYVSPGSGNAWNFNTNDGNQNNNDVRNGLYAVAVRSGG